MMKEPNEESKPRPGYRRHEVEPIDDRQQAAAGDTVYEELGRVEAACDQYIQLRRTSVGESKDGVPAVETFAARFPDIESQILDLLPTILMMEKARDRHVGKRKDGRVDSGPEQLSQLDDFIIGRELGRGGMGIVHAARQVSLDRQVALKILPRHTLTPKQIAQFQQEASTVAKLHHSNIAPVYAVGEKDGVHYFAMQLLEGSSLENVGESKELSVKDVASIGKQVAQALQYAHDQGVFHRDIKPANLILDPDMTVWVTDFGLATTRQLGSETQGHRAAGTLRYMPPEALDPDAHQGDFDLGRADTYSLGVTLMELLTGQPAFEAAKVKELTKAIGAGEFRPMTFRGKRIARDMEAVLKKSVSVDPNERYLTASDFADDLSNFEHGMSVKARPTSAVGQSLRWAKRNPYLAFASGLAALSMIVTSLVMTISQLQIKDSLTAERRQRVRAENASRLGAQSIDRIFNQFGSDSNFLDEQVGLGAGFASSASPLSQDSAAMLKELSGFYDQLASDDLNSHLPIKAVMARRRVGEIQQRMGAHAAAVESFEEALDVYTGLIESGRIRRNADVVVRLARIRNQLGYAFNVSGDFEKSATEHQRSIANLKLFLSDLEGSEADSDPQSDSLDSLQRINLELARSHYLLAYRTRPGMGPNSLPPNMSADGHSIARDLGPQRQGNLEQAVAILDSLEESLEGPVESVRKYLLAISHREIAPDALVDLSSSDREHHAKAIGLLEELIEANQGVSIYKLELMKTLADINVFASGYKEPEIEAAYQSLKQAVEIGAELTESQPNDVGVQLESIHAFAKLAKITGLKGELLSLPLKDEKEILLQEKEENVRAALLGQSFLAKQHPDSLAYQSWIAYFSLELAQCSTMANRPAERRRLISETINTLFQMPADFRKRPAIARIEANAKRLSGELLVGDGVETED